MSLASSVRPRFLVTGPRGQVGWELRRALAPLGEVLLADRNPTAGLPPLDLADPASVRAVVRAARPDVIVNAAAYTAVDKAESELDLAVAVNGDAPGALAEEAAKIGAAVVHYSTDYVFDGAGTRRWREDDPTGPINAYGVSKLAGEQAVRAAGAPHLILRVCWVYGVRGKNFVKTMLRLGADRERLSVVGDQVGAPTTARAIADATAAVLARGGRDVPAFLAGNGGTFHLCPAGETTWHGFAEAIFAGARVRGQVLKVGDVQAIGSADYPTPARRPTNSRMDCSRLRDAFGVALPDWRDGLDLCLDDLIGEPVAAAMSKAA